MTHKTQYKYNLKKTQKSNLNTFSKGLTKHVLIYFLMLIHFTTYSRINHLLHWHWGPNPTAPPNLDSLGEVSS